MRGNVRVNPVPPPADRSYRAGSNDRQGVPVTRDATPRRPALAAALAACLAAVALAPAAATATPVDEWQIIEGHGITDDYAFLGMTLAEAQTRIARSYSGSCYDFYGTQRCDLTPQAAGPMVRVFFDGGAPESVATSIQVYPGIWLDWPTPRGASSHLPLSQKPALYPGAVIRDGRSSSGGARVHERTVTSRDTGYLFHRRLWCLKDAPGECDLSYAHEIFPAGQAPQAHPVEAGRTPGR